MTRPRNHRWLVAVALLASLLAGCSRTEKALPVSAERIAAPFQEFAKSTLYSYSGPHKRWKLESEYMRKDLDQTGKVLVVPVVLTLYDSLGRPASRILSDSGTTTGSMVNFTVWGNVYIKTDEGQVIRTQKLWWVKNTHKIYSNTYVQIRTPSGDVLRGKGLDAEEDFSRWSLKQNVSGRFPEFRKRMGEDESVGK